MKFIYTLLTACGLVTSASQVSWATSDVISPAGPFAGTMQENWESFPAFTGVYPPSPIRIMQGQAEIASPVLAFFAPQQGLLGSSGFAQLIDGVRGLMVNQFDQTATISWSTPISRFGGYFAEATLPPGYNKDPNRITINFYGAGNQLIRTLRRRTAAWTGMAGIPPHPFMQSPFTATMSRWMHCRPARFLSLDRWRFFPC